MVTVTINSVVGPDPSGGTDFTQNEEIVDGLLTLSGDYGDLSPANGDIIDFSSDLIKSQQPPRRVEIFQLPPAGQAPVQYSFLYGQGTGQENGVLIVIDTTTGLAITDNAAYPAALTDDDPAPNIRFRAWFPSFI